VRECPGGKPGRGVKAEGGITVARGGKGKASAPFVGRVPLHHRPTRIFLKGLSQSVLVGTRKIVNYG